MSQIGPFSTLHSFFTSLQYYPPNYAWVSKVAPILRSATKPLCIVVSFTRVINAALLFCDVTTVIFSEEYKPSDSLVEVSQTALYLL